MNQSTLCSKEGWNVLHLFYRIDHATWRLLNDKNQLNAKATMSLLAKNGTTSPTGMIVALANTFAPVFADRLLGYLAGLS